jgi:hypothetical protein
VKTCEADIVGLGVERLALSPPLSYFILRCYETRKKKIQTRMGLSEQSSYQRLPRFTDWAKLLSTQKTNRSERTNFSSISAAAVIWGTDLFPSELRRSRRPSILQSLSSSASYNIHACRETQRCTFGVPFGIRGSSLVLT